jgi:hypothetical protein
VQHAPAMQVVQRQQQLHEPAHDHVLLKQALLGATSAALQGTQCRTTAGLNSR